VRVLSLALVILLTAFVAAIPRAASAQIDSIVLHADRVAFYSAKYIVTADNNVSVRLTDGTTITGRTFWMDLKSNRFMVAGGVHVVHGSISYDGAAFSEFIDYKRAYFLPLLSEPDRWTFLDEDYSKPVPGREMPGDTFEFPDTGGDHAFVLAKQAKIIPKTGVEFKPARIYAFGAYTPAPEYYVNFSPNPYFAENSLAGATGAVGYPFMGSKNATSTLYGRYDSANGLYLAAEENLASPNAYAVFSINPLTRPGKQYNFLGSYKTPNQRFQLTNFDQFFAFQSGFSQPLNSSALENEQLTYGLRNSFLQLNANEYQDSLLAQPAPDSNGNYWYGTPEHDWLPNHPTNITLSWIGSRQQVSKYVPINFDFRGGVTQAHDIYGLGTFNGVTYATYWQHYLGFTVWSNPFRLTPHAPFDQSVYFSETYDRQRTFVDSMPGRFQDAGTLTSTLSKLQGHKGATYLSYIISNTGDYLGPLQQVVYPPTIIDNPYDNQIYPGYAAFDGFSTTRDLQFAYIYTPTPYFSFTIQADKHNDFPAPIPYYYGNPPYSIAFRTQIRINSILSVQIAKSYSFNFGNEGWSSWTIQFGP
jgi:hypothetical protein